MLASLPLFKNKWRELGNLYSEKYMTLCYYTSGKQKDLSSFCKIAIRECASQIFDQIWRYLTAKRAAYSTLIKILITTNSGLGLASWSTDLLLDHS